MSETTDAADPTGAEGADRPAEAATRKRGGALGSMLIADLRSLAGGLGVAGSGSMKKAQLVEAIRAAQSGSRSGDRSGDASPRSGRAPASVPDQDAAPDQGAASAPTVARRTRARAVTPEPAAAPEPAAPEQAAAGTAAPTSASAADTSDTSGAAAPVVRTRTRSRSASKTPAAADPTGPEQSGPPQSGPPQSGPEQSGPEQPGRTTPGHGSASEAPPEDQSSRAAENPTGRRRRGDRPDRQEGSAAQEQPGGQDKQDRQGGQDKQDGQRGQKNQRGQQGDQQDRSDQGGKQPQQGRNDRSERNDQQSRQERERPDRQDRQDRQGQPSRDDRQSRGDQGDQSDQGDDLEAGGRNRRRRGRDRERNRPLGGGTGTGQRSEPDTTILEDDVLVPAAGILDVLDNYAFVRTSGYLPGPDDVYVSLSMVRRFGLRRGDALVGQVRQPREGERKEKFNPMVQIDAVNGNEPEASKNRVDFDRLTPLHPSERLRLETGPGNLVGRVIDLAAPIGKGQRGLVVSPPDAGKTELLRSIASSVTANHPECHLMVVLLDERPEEVTDFERAVNGEVVSSTFDRPPGDHTAVAELAVERAKRLVELGHDVVVLLDGITRLGRAYDLAAAPHGRQLPGGLDAAALHPTKRFFGAARNLENGGSLTILATASVETGSAADAAILDALAGTGNLVIRLRGDLAAQRLFPAIDAVASGTRHEELLMSAEEVAIVHKLRAELAELDAPRALGSLLERLRRTQTNIEFLMQVQRSG